jgi:hypothetical protein
MGSNLAAFWDAVIGPHVARARPAVVVLVGAGDGRLPEALLDAAADWGGVVHVADAAPAFDVTALRRRGGDRVVVHVGRPADTLGLLVVPDLLLLDGDPNYYAVQTVLRAADAQSARLGRGFPLTLVGETGWPAGRRDGYLNPAAIPEAFRHAHERAGVRPGQAGPGAGGLFGERWNAVQAHAPRGGVMTAIEDVASAAQAPLGVMTSPVLHGLSVIYAVRDADAPAVRGLLEALRAGESAAALAALAGEEWVAVLVALGDAERALESERVLVGMLRDRLRVARESPTRPVETTREISARELAGLARRKLARRKRDLVWAVTGQLGARREAAQAVEAEAGRLARLRASPVFDAAWYVRAYPDVAQAGADPATHYDRFGAAEGRDPGPYFSTSFYLDRNPDVAAAGLNPLWHYLTDGGREGRDPSPYFSSAYYLEHAPDVAEAGINPLEHFLSDGLIEGRRVRP